MYYASGNYEAFVRPPKPQDVEKKSAYLVGSGLAALSAAAFLVRDGQMPGKNIHILEEMDLPGGACDGIKDTERGFVMRGGREMENHFECLWDLFHSIPSIEHEGQSVLDEIYYLNAKDPNYSLERATIERGHSAHTENKFSLTEKAQAELTKLFLTPDEQLYDKKISDVLGEDFMASNFWMYWRTMFAFETWHSALEMKLYLQRFVHHIQGLPDFSALKFTKYNQYESLIQPLVRYLELHHVDFQYGVTVTNVIFEKADGKKIARSIELMRVGKPESIQLTENDLVFVTNGSCTENSSKGSQDEPAILNRGTGPVWELWKKIANQDPSFGHPEKFCTDIDATNWESATLTTLDKRIPAYVEKVCKRNPFDGKVTTGGIVTIKDSNWLMSYTFNRQPHFKTQPETQTVGWIYGLFTDRPGNWIKKPMLECTGEEITEEWLFHLGVPEKEIHDLAMSGATCVPVIMPYITAFFMPRRAGDRPDVVPQGCVNFAFIGQFAETKRDCIFTTEYSVRTGMEAVYTLLDIQRGVPEVWASCYDVRALTKAMYSLSDGKKLTDIKLPLAENIARKKLLEKIEGTDIEVLLKEAHLI
ncbi:MAG: oleate hydratase [Anaerolineaceae bacterium]|nr:oleate hydratase [Anaerolineaceae bacterium]